MLRVFVRDVRGVVAIEFALVMLPFSLLIFGIIEVAVLYLGAISLEDAVASAMCCSAWNIGPLLGVIGVQNWGLITLS